MPYVAADLKFLNRKTVYELLVQRRELTRTEIVRATGISAPTVMKIVDYLKELGCVRETGAGSGALGRRPQILRYDAGVGYAVGVDFSGVEIRIGIVDFGGTIRYLKTTPAVPEFGFITGDAFSEMLRAAIAESGVPAERVYGLCLGLPGVVNKDRRTIELAPLVGVTDPIDYSRIAGALSEKLEMPVYVENDANVSAQGEFIAGGGVQGDLLFVRIGKGLGAGILLGGRLHYGRNYFAGELGYMVFDRDWRSRRSEAGWVEKTIRLDEIRAAETVPPERLEELADDLALVIVNLCVPFDIGTVVLDAIRDRAFYEALLERVQEKLQRLSALSIVCRSPVCPEPGIIGAAYQVINPAVEHLLEG